MAMISSSSSSSSAWILTHDAFDESNSYLSLFITGFVYFGFFYGIEGLVTLALTKYASSSKKKTSPDSPQATLRDLLRPYKSRRKIARNLTEVILMSILTLMGFQAFFVMEGLNKWYGRGIGMEQLFVFDKTCQRLLLFQLVYQVKNFITSYVFEDGMLYLAHHTAAATLAAMACDPFLHYYSPFFFGMCELSTVFLCAYLCFDAKSGIPELSKLFPTSKFILSILFFISFLLVRIVVWVFFSYHFWFDMIALYQAGMVHNHFVWWTFAVINVGLTSLQFYWLGDILKEAFKATSNSSSSPSSPSKHAAVKKD